jgi:hypothetical protein
MVFGDCLDLHDFDGLLARSQRALLLLEQRLERPDRRSLLLERGRLRHHGLVGGDRRPPVCRLVVALGLAQVLPVRSSSCVAAATCSSSGFSAARTAACTSSSLSATASRGQDEHGGRRDRPHDGTVDPGPYRSQALRPSTVSADSRTTHGVAIARGMSEDR